MRVFLIATAFFPVLLVLIVCLYWLAYFTFKGL